MRISIFLIASMLILQVSLVAAASNLQKATASDNDGLVVEYSSPNPVVAFTVVVSRNGFNGTSSAFTLQVNQGDEVKITFLYGDGDLSWDNPHIITIDGYSITTAAIDKNNPNATVQFIAGQAGQFKFYCSTPCFGMENLQQGLLDVTAGGSGTVRTSIALLHCHMHPGSFLHMIVSLEDQQGNPVPGVSVHFDLNTDLGWMEAGRNVTSPNGFSTFMYQLKSSALDEAAAVFPGSGSYAPSNVTAIFTPISLTGAFGGSPFLSGQNSLIDFRLVGVPPLIGVFIVSIVLVVVASVWLTYSYVLKQILNIRRNSTKKDEGGSA